MSRATRAIGLAMLALIALLAPQRLWAFPEMVRKGYNNCSVCHYSPTGGGVLRQYGRELSREELSTWGKEGEERALYGALKRLPKWAAVGGDLRAVQAYRDNTLVRQGRFIVMQLDAEAALSKTFKKGTVMLVGTAGIDKIEKSVEPKGGFISRRHYVGYRPTDELSFRGGRFLPAYGINTADHIIVTRRGLGFDQGSETYNAEAAWVGESLNVFATGIFGRPDAKLLNREKGGAFQAGYSFSDSYRAGVNYYYGSNDTAKRQLAGPWGILGFTPRLFLLTEWDLRWYKPQSVVQPGQVGVVGYDRFDYEVHKGVHLYLAQEYSQTNWTTNQTLFESYGLGVQLFPRPHFEVNMLWSKQRTLSLSETQFGDLGYVMLHYYL